MEFFATYGKRPVRLSESTRQFAWESLHHKYGKETEKTPAIPMDDIADFETWTDIQKYDEAIKQIAEQAPLRICHGEKVSGAATLGLAMWHKVPASYGGNPVFESVSHLTIDFETVVKQGIGVIEEQAHQALKRFVGTEKEPFARSCVNCFDSMHKWHVRYLHALKDGGYDENYRTLSKVPFAPATNFREAVQSLWFTFAFVRLCGNWPGIGRIDWLLGDYLENDLKNGTITVEEAREWLAHFFIKGCEWIRGDVCRSGDAQHYQNILLGGVDENGKEVTNTVTYLVLDVLEELGISDFPTSVRLNRNSPQELLRRVAEVTRYGGGVIAVYNEDLVIESLTQHGYPLCEARKFANDGCWEVQVPGKTKFGYIPFDALGLLQRRTLRNYAADVTYDTFEALYTQFMADIRWQLEEFHQNTCDAFYDSSLPPNEWVWKPTYPCTVVSVFEQGCIENGICYMDGGTTYFVVSPHIGGLPDAVNSLYAIKRLVFDEKRISFSELMTCLQNDWEGNEPLRQYVQSKYAYFGNDNDEVDEIARRVVDDFAAECERINQKTRVDFVPGISTFGRQVDWAPVRLATPFGRRAKAVLSGNYSPTPGTDKEGATAIIKSYCKADLRKMITGAALDIRLLPGNVEGENGLEGLISLFRGFVTLGGHFMQLDIADAALLKEAQAHPENYRTLSVRVSGWNARFVTLSKAWQDMIIQQNGGTVS